MRCMEEDYRSNMGEDEMPLAGFVLHFCGLFCEHEHLVNEAAYSNIA